MYISFKYQSSVSFRAEYPFKEITKPVENYNKPPLNCLKHSVQLHHRLSVEAAAAVDQSHVIKSRMVAVRKNIELVIFF